LPIHAITYLNLPSVLFRLRALQDRNQEGEVGAHTKRFSGQVQELEAADTAWLERFLCAYAKVSYDELETFDTSSDAPYSISTSFEFKC